SKKCPLPQAGSRIVRSRGSFFGRCGMYTDRLRSSSCDRAVVLSSASLGADLPSSRKLSLDLHTIYRHWSLSFVSPLRISYQMRPSVWSVKNSTTGTIQISGQHVKREESRM